MNIFSTFFKIIVVTLILSASSFLFNSCAIVEIKGKVVDSKKNPLSVNVIWQNLVTGDTIDNMRNDSLTGDYRYLLPQHIHYGYTFYKEGYFPVFKNIDLRNNNEVYTNEEDIVLTMLKVEEVIAKGSFVVDNVFFSNNSKMIDDGSKYALRAFGKFITDNKFTKLEVHGYTDATGDDSYNIKLSMARAETVSDFLRGFGCSQVSFTAKGFGKANPIASNETEQGRSKNRRVEIKIIK